MKKPLLKISNLTKKYRRRGEKTTVLNIPAFEIYRGELLALAGESGSGKTTFGRCLLRLEKADSGKIFYGQQEILGMRAGRFRKMRPKFQMIFQDPAAALNPRQTMRQALTEPLQMLGKLSGIHLEERLTKACDEVQLPANLLERMPHELSSGQMQRVCIARALCVQPELLVADEPTANLDALIKWQILDLLQTLQKKHAVAIFFITHDLAAIEEIAGRVAVMEKGAIREITFKNQPSTGSEILTAAKSTADSSISYP